MTTDIKYNFWCKSDFMSTQERSLTAEMSPEMNTVRQRWWRSVSNTGGNIIKSRKAWCVVGKVQKPQMAEVEAPSSTVTEGKASEKRSVVRM